MNAGTVIADRYRLIAPLGEGAMGVVWRARQTGLDRDVAIKLMHATYARHVDSRARFEREARVAAQLHHPAAVGVLDFGEHGGVLFLVMELLVGRPLRDRLEEGPMSLTEALPHARAIASALNEAHRIHLVHRDIKPENIFLEATPGGEQARVVDFGLAFIAEADGVDSEKVGRLTDEGTLGGTPAYMSPEMVRGRSIGPASDIYSFGCTLFEMLTGQPPFIGPLAELFTKHAYAAAPSLSDLVERAPIALVDLVAAMLNKSPLLRPPPDKVLATLSQLIDGATEERTGASVRTLDRAARLSIPPPMGAKADAGLAVQVAMIGTVEDDVALGLSAHGLELADAISPATHVVFAPGATMEGLRALVAQGVPVVTDVAIGNVGEMTERLKLGVADCVTRPLVVAEVARKLTRAGKRAGRGSLEPGQKPPIKA